MDALERVERSIAETWRHIDRQRHVIDVLHEHGHQQDVPTAELLLQTLTTSLGDLCELKANLQAEMAGHGAGWQRGIAGDRWQESGLSPP